MRTYIYGSFFTALVSIGVYSSAVAQVSSSQPGITQTIRDSSGTPLAMTKLAGLSYLVPVNYLAYPIKPEGQSDLLIRAKFPEFSALNIKGSDGKVRGFGDNLTVLVTDASSTTTHEFRYNAAQKRLSPMEPTIERFGLKTFVSTKNENGMKMDGTESSFKNGQRVSATELDKKKLVGEFFISDNGSVPQTYIICSGDLAQRMPGCWESFNDDGLLYKVTFGKDHLSQWKEIKNGSIELIKSFKKQ